MVWELDNQPGPAVPLTDFELERMVQTLVDGRPAQPGRGFFTRTSPWVAAAAILVFALPPVAWGAHTAWRRWVRPASAPVTPTNPSRAKTIDAAAEAPSADPSLHRMQPQPRAKAPVLQKSPPRPAAAKPPNTPSGRVEKRRPSTAQLLAEASRLRREQRWFQAAETYARVRRKASKPSEVHVGACAEGQLRLDRLSDPRGALRAFQAALRALPGGPLAAEAQLGQGDALRQLGQKSEARGAWRRVIRHHAGTHAADQARARLEDKSGAR